MNYPCHYATNNLHRNRNSRFSALAGFFENAKSPEASKRAVSAIRTAIENASVFPERFRPVPDLMHYREIIIDFGCSGYIARFRYEQGGDIHIVRIKHQLENEYPNR